MVAWKTGVYKNFSWDLTLYLQSQTSWGNKCATERGKTLFFDYLYSAYATWASSIFSPPNRYSCCGAEFRSIFFFACKLKHTAERFSSTKRSREKQQPNNLVIEHNCRYILSAAEESRKVSDVASSSKSFFVVRFQQRAWLAVNNFYVHAR